MPRADTYNFSFSRKGKIPICQYCGKMFESASGKHNHIHKLHKEEIERKRI